MELARCMERSNACAPVPRATRLLMIGSWACLPLAARHRRRYFFLTAASYLSTIALALRYSCSAAFLARSSLAIAACLFISSACAAAFSAAAMVAAAALSAAALLLSPGCFVGFRRLLALAMGTHARLGAGSWMLKLAGQDDALALIVQHWAAAEELCSNGECVRWGR